MQNKTLKSKKTSSAAIEKILRKLTKYNINYKINYLRTFSWKQLKRSNSKEYINKTERQVQSYS
jgi:hypothetical protein